MIPNVQYDTTQYDMILYHTKITVDAYVWGRKFI